MKDQHKRYSWRRWLFIAFPLLALVMFFAVQLSAQAASVVNEVIPISGSEVNPCNGEFFTFSGTIHFVTHETFDNNGGDHSDLHENIHFTGTGNQGNNYVGNQTINNLLNVKVGEEQTLTETIEFISQGSAPNFLLHFLFHITVNANGDVTAFVDHFTTECKG